MSPDPPSTDHRRATAERNVERILDAAAALLARGAAASTTAVATEAGVSRPTVYAHFPTREALVEAVAARAVAGATAALADAHLDDGSPLEALDRLIEVAWDHLDRGGAIARAAGDQLSSEAMTRAHPRCASQSARSCAAARRRARSAPTCRRPGWCRPTSR